MYMQIRKPKKRDQLVLKNYFIVEIRAVNKVNPHVIETVSQDKTRGSIKDAHTPLETSISCRPVADFFFFFRLISHTQ